MATILLGQHAILVALTLGAASVFVEHWVVNVPITRLCEAVSVTLAAGCFGASLLVFVALPGSKDGSAD